jgi:hypothetical protein
VQLQTERCWDISCVQDTQTYRLNREIAAHSLLTVVGLTQSRTFSKLRPLKYIVLNKLLYYQLNISLFCLQPATITTFRQTTQIHNAKLHISIIIFNIIPSLESRCPTSLLASRFPAKSVCQRLFCIILATVSAHHILLMKRGEALELRGTPFCRFVRLPFTLPPPKAVVKVTLIACRVPRQETGLMDEISSILNGNVFWLYENIRS